MAVGSFRGRPPACLGFATPSRFAGRGYWGTRRLTRRELLQVYDVGESYIGQLTDSTCLPTVPVHSRLAGIRGVLSYRLVCETGGGFFSFPSPFQVGTSALSWTQQASPTFHWPFG